MIYIIMEKNADWGECRYPVWAGTCWGAALEELVERRHVATHKRDQGADDITLDVWRGKESWDTVWEWDELLVKIRAVPVSHEYFLSSGQRL